MSILFQQNKDNKNNIKYRVEMYLKCSKQQDKTKNRLVQALCIDQNCSQDRNICLDCINNHENHFMIDVYYLKSILKQALNENNNSYQQLENYVFTQINEIKQNNNNYSDLQEQQINNILSSFKSYYNIQSIYEQIISPQLTTNDFHSIGAKLSKILYQVIKEEKEIIKIKQLSFDNLQHCQNIQQLKINLENLYLKKQPILSLIQQQSQSQLYQKQSNFKLILKKSQQSDILSVAISSDNKIIATGGLKDLTIWNFQNLQIIKQYSFIQLVNCTLFSQDNNKLIAAGFCQNEENSFDNNIIIFGKNNLQFNPIITLQGHTDYIIRIYAALELNFLISASIDQTIRIWQTKNGQEIMKYESRNEVYGIAYTGLYDIIGACFQGGKVMIVEKQDLRLTEKQIIWQAHFENTYYIEFIQNGRLIITSGNKRIKFWVLGKILNKQFNVEREFRCPESSPIWMVKTNLSNFPNLMISCNGKIQIWNFESQQLIQTLAIEDGLISILCKNKILQNGWQFAMSNDGQFIISGGSDGLKIFVNST